MLKHYGLHQMTFEKDMEYANNILRIRTAMEDGSIVAKDGIRSFSTNPTTFEYIMEFCGEDVVIGYLERRITRMANFVTSGEIYYDYRSNRIHTRLADGGSLVVNVDKEVIDEAWYFQNSLVYNHDVLRALMAVKTLQSVESKYEYFQLKTRHIDNILYRL